MGQPLWKTVIVGQALKRLNIKSQYDPATPPKRCEKLSHKHLYTTVGSITHNSQQVKTTNGCMVKQKWCIYTMECNSTIKRNKVRQTDSGFQGLVGEGVTTNGHEVSFWSDENTLKLNMVTVGQQYM